MKTILSTETRTKPLGTFLDKFALDDKALFYLFFSAKKNSCLPAERNHRQPLTRTQLQHSCYRYPVVVILLNDDALRKSTQEKQQCLSLDQSLIAESFFGPPRGYTTMCYGGGAALPSTAGRSPAGVPLDNAERMETDEDDDLRYTQ